MPRNALGRGLGALIREHDAQPTSVPNAPAGGPATGVASAREIPPTNASVTRELDIDLIEPSPYQPRSHFREEALEELARSVRASGIIQPLIVRPVGNRFQLIAGRSEEHTSELQSRLHLVCRLLLEKKKKTTLHVVIYTTRRHVCMKSDRA